MKDPFDLAQKYLEPDPYETDVGAERTQPSTEALVVSMLAEIQPGEIAPILAIWEKLFNIYLDPEKIEKHLNELKEWQGQWAALRRQSRED